MIRSFITFAIKKPIINHLILLFLLVVATFAYISIPKEIFPPSTLDKIKVTGAYAGASADTLDKMAVQSIEDDLKSISEIAKVESVIQNGSFIITAEIKEGSEPYLILGDVKDVISKIKSDLPADMNEPVAKVQTQNFPLLIVAIAGEVPKARLLDAGEELKSELSSIKALSDMSLRGDADEEVLISLDSKKLQSYDLQRSAVISALQELSSIFPIGTVKQQGQHLYISTINGVKSARALAKTMITVGEKRLFVGDIAKVEYKLGDSGEISHFNGQRNVSLSINKSKEGNAIALSRQIREILKGYEQKYPELTFEAYTDTSKWIRNRLNTVISNIFFGLILVFSALFLTVNSRIALVVGIGIPASFMIGLVSANVMGYSLNMLSLLGALIALGMIVDEAIVVAENIYRHRQMDKSATQAAIDGAVEMFPAVLTATLTTIFAFLPLLMISGEMGVFLKVLPIMISILLLSSLFEAFYFLPLHAKDFIKPSRRDSRATRFWGRMNRIYEALIDFVLHHKKSALIFSVSVILGLTAYMQSISKFQLFPEFDTTQIYINGNVNINNELEDTERYVSEVEKLLLQKLDRDAVKSVTSVIGIKIDSKNQAEFGEHLFHIFVNLNDRKPQNVFDKYINPYLSPEYDDSEMKRERSAKEIGQKIERITAEVAARKQGSEPLFEEFNVVLPSAGIVKRDVEIGFSHPDTQKVLGAINRMQKALGEIEGVYDIATDAKEGELELKLKVNPYGQELGFSEGYLTRVLQSGFLKNEYGKLFNDSGLIKLRIQDRYKDSVEFLNRLEIATPDARAMVRLRDVTEFIYQKSFVKIYKENSRRVRSVFASLDKDMITSAEVMERLRPLLGQLRSEGLNVHIKGEQKENEKVQREIMQAAVIALLLIFITLVWMFDSTVLALIVISTIPLAILGVFIGHFIMGMNITLPSLIGIVGLAGVVVNDALIMLDFIKGSHTKEQLIQKAKLRLRPILLTSLTTLLGLATLMFFASGQAKILQPMAVTLGFGIAWATVVNLYVVPLLYSIIYRVKVR